MVVIGTGTFCIANYNVAFVSVAFVVGIALLFLGAAELSVNRGRAIQGDSDEVDIEGMIAVLVGAVFLSGEVSEDVAVTTLFGIWTIVEGLRSVSSTHFNIRANTTSDNVAQILGVVTTLLGVYSFFNISLFDFKVLGLVGVSLLLIGTNRFRFALMVDYKKPEFLTGNHEKLADAKHEEKIAMQKAKDAIRETKAIQKRITDIDKAIAKEGSLTVNEDDRRRTKGNK